MNDGNAILKRALQGNDPLDLNALAATGVIRIRVTELDTRCAIQSIAFSDDMKDVLFAVTGGDISRLQTGRRYVVVVYDVLLEAEDTQL